MEEYIRPLGASIHCVAVALQIPYSHLSEITEGNHGITTHTALRLERYFGSESRGWLKLQNACDFRVAEPASGETIMPRKNNALDGETGRSIEGRS